jgi:quercetin dioxygenase-like cupin family protein
MHRDRLIQWATGLVAVFIVLALPAALAGGLDTGAGLRVLAQRPLPDLPGKEGLVLRVDYPPGHEGVPHRHDAHSFVYLLEGSIEMQVAGGPRVVMKPGDVFYEGPDDIHPVGRNLSATKTAKLLVFFVKDLGKAPVLPPGRN